MSKTSTFSALDDERFKQRTLSANGIRVHAVEAGQGPLVLLAHGFPESWYSWRHQLRALADAGYRAVAIDMRGYGRTSKPAAVHDYRITELVADCVGVVHALGESQAVIVGHDWGSAVAWTAAWTRPDVFRAVVGVSVPFGGRGQMALPGNPFGERRPSEVEREIAGPGRLWYQEYFTSPGVADREFHSDPAAWLTGALYSFSASAPQPPEAAAVDFTQLSDQALAAMLREAVCLPPGVGMRDGMTPMPDDLPDWLTQEDIDFYVAEFERTGFTGPLNYYHCLDLNWELLAPYEGRPLEVPALFVGGGRDIATLWGRTAMQRFPEVAPQAREPIVIADAGHWLPDEKPQELNKALLEFLAGL
ncbi:MULTISPECIES: alpha/beta hydrolase [Streptomyces]|uniref:alpha/beta fold hydrolase n=1 Tax=Streptomyces TaxID=1883 RepID=UPI00099EE9D0|nr:MULTISPECIES: alpha/beta hydrolase [Streptomyces]MDI5912642.1 alpha/beta hydrolase [Streptomyces sp. 12257]